jgi:hypothetical protein
MIRKCYDSIATQHDRRIASSIDEKNLAGEQLDKLKILDSEVQVASSSNKYTVVLSNPSAR